MATRLRRVALVAMLAFVLVACDVDILVEVDVATDGSGTVAVEVVLDEEAAERIPDLTAILRLDDLVETGWEIDGPADTLEDGIRISATKTFDGPEQLQAVLDEITGAEGALQGFVLTRTPEFAQVDLDLAGTVDLSRGVALFTDAELVESLSGLPLGIDIDELETEIGPVEDAVDITFIARLPGTTDDEADGAEVVVTPRLGDAPVPIAVSTTDEVTLAKILRLVGFAAAALAVVALLVNIVIWFVEWRRRRREPPIRTPEPLRPTPAPVPVVPATGPSRAPGRRLGVVVVDSYGVLYEPLLGVLIDFARSRGSNLDDEAIAERYDEAAEGRLSTAELWSALGVNGDPDKLDLALVSQVRLRSGARAFVSEMRRRGMNVTALGNNIAVWSDALRVRDKFGDVEPWINSSDAGVRSPQPGLFEAMRRATGVPFEDWLIIDADLEALDTAKTLGMTTVWFTKELPPANHRPDHSIVSGFGDFFRRRS